MNRVIQPEITGQLELFQAQEIVRPDINIGRWAGFIFASPWAKDLHTEKRIEFKSGENLTAAITIIPSVNRKRPTTTTQKVFLALLQIWEQSERPANGKITFSARQLAHLLNWKWAGKDTANRLQEQLSILNNTTIDWERSFASGNEIERHKEEMRLIDAKSYLTREKMESRELFYSQHTARLNPDLVENMLKGNTKPFNYLAYLSIKNDGALTLYNLLDNFLSKKNKWERRSYGLLVEDLELTGKRYEQRRLRLAKLKELKTALDGKELSSGRLSIEIEKTKDGEDYKLVARKTARIKKNRRPPKLANSNEDIPLIVADIISELEHVGITQNVNEDILKVIAQWYDRDLIFQALSIVKADLRNSIKTTPIKAFMYQLHLMVHERKKDWIRDCGSHCPHRPENRKKDLFKK